MSHLAKLNLKSVDRNAPKDPVITRRQKLLRKLEEQMRVADAALAGDVYTVQTTRVARDETGERKVRNVEKTVKAWYFEQNKQWYVQCKYGVRTLRLSDKANAICVGDLAAVKGALEALYAACAAGEFDAQLTKLTKLTAEK